MSQETLFCVLAVTLFGDCTVGGLPIATAPDGPDGFLPVFCERAAAERWAATVGYRVTEIRTVGASVMQTEEGQP